MFVNKGRQGHLWFMQIVLSNRHTVMNNACMDLYYSTASCKLSFVKLAITTEKSQGDNQSKVQY